MFELHGMKVNWRGLSRLAVDLWPTLDKLLYSKRSAKNSCYQDLVLFVDCLVFGCTFSPSMQYFLLCSTFFCFMMK